jgi:predicted nucleotidyltransferase
VSAWPEFRLQALLRALVSHGVDFVVIGGVAMVAHGSTRYTDDLDICYATDPTNLELLGQTLVELGAKLRGVTEDVPFVPDAQTLRRISLLTLTTPEGDIDVHVGPSGAPGYETLRRRASRVELHGMAILVASLDDLESMKRAAGRPLDLQDVEEIEVIRRLQREHGYR